jgi:hypothetical protein
MTAFVCAACGRDLRLVPHKVDEDGRRLVLELRADGSRSRNRQPTTTPEPGFVYVGRKFAKEAVGESD